METAVTALEWVQNAIFVVVAVWAFRRWRRHRSASSQWVAATFLALAGIIVLGFISDGLEEGTPLATAVSFVSLAGLAAFPYLLLRFHETFNPLPVWFRRTVAAAAVAVFVLAIPLLGADAPGPDSPLFVAVLVLLAANWTVPLVTIAVRFWRAGKQQPTLVRRRLRLLAIATAALGLALVLVVAGSSAGGTDQEEQAPAFLLAVQGMTILAAGSFLVGFAPPAPLRSYWRQSEERALHDASVRLMGATTPDEVARLLVPHLRAVLAARAVALVHRDEVLASAGLGQEGAAALEVGDGKAATNALSNGALHVWPNPYTPFFSDEEFNLLERVAVLTDLALARTGLLAREQQARRELEAANAELESFVYSASHDLKSPLIAIQSYLDIFDEEVADVLEEDTSWYLHRMRSNAEYMAALVGDLLELSRVGRVDTTPEVVDVEAVVAEVAVEVREQYSEVEVNVAELPELRMNPLRCRQLFHNLVENAAAHAPDGRVTVWVDARSPEDDDGDAVVVYVRDDGDGIPVEYRDRIFGVFERLQAEGSDTRSTGIGLAICRKIVDGIDGRIWVTDHDGGAEFAILFPGPAVASTTSHETTEVPA